MPQPVSGRSHVQDGDGGAHQSMPPSRFLGHIVGFAGCIFPHSRSSSIPEVPPLPDRKGVFSVSRPALRHRHGTLALHHGDGRGKKNCSPMGNSAFPILGRLVNTGLIKRPMCATHKASAGSVRPDGPPGQSQEVGASTHSGICLPRVRFSSHNVPLFSTSKEDAENLGSHSQNHQTPRSASTHLASTTGSPRIIREDGSSWSPSHEGNSLLAPGVLGLRPTHVQPIRPSVSIGTQRSLMVDVGVQCVPGFTHCASGSNRPLPHGRISIGMGSALGHAHHLRTMDSGGSGETYQRSRVRRGGQSLRKVETPSVRPENSGRTRQFDCSCLPEPPRRHQVASPSPSHRAHVRALRWRLLHLGGQTHTREKERPCRQPLRGGVCGIRRVDPQPLGLPRHLSSLGITHRRPVCHKTKHSSSHLRVADTRCGGHGYRRHVPGLEGDVGVCVPTTRLTSTDSSQDPVLALQNNLGRSVVAGVMLVRSTVSTTSRLSSNTTTTTRPTHTGRDPPQGSFRTKDTCVAVIRQALTLRGFSEPVAERAARPQRDSTIAIYESKWCRFVDWCSGRKIDPFSTSSAVIGDFLLFLFQQKLAISTLEGYRMAIASTLRATSGVEVGRCDTLRSLLKNLECERARSRRQAPDWDLSLVLRRLRLPPFEPLSTCSLQLLTWKTVFLFALASGKRRGEIHALLLDSFAHTQDWSSISFSVSPSFLSKTALSDRGADLLLSIPALSNLASSDLPDDLRLCPVRAFRCYLQRTHTPKITKVTVYFTPGTCPQRHFPSLHL